VTEVSLDDVRAAAGRLGTAVVRTPLERSRELSEVCGVDVWLKFECFQHTGSFKLRGALNALQLLDGQTSVVTASAGNHGLGVAHAASMLGMGAIVVIPRTASQAKVDALRSSGAEVLLEGETYDTAESAAIRLAHERGLPFISPYNDAAVVAGGGTIALEIFDDLPDVRSLIVPAGGGGLISGIGVASHGLAREAAVYGVQSEASPALHAALEHGRLVTVEVLPSLADGLAGNIEAGSITFELLRRYVRRVDLVSEQAIAEAMAWLLLHERVVVEGSAAVGVAALLRRTLAPEGPVAVLLTGRNVAESVLREYVYAPVRIPSV
jgi:threonine dehydratase